MRRLLSSLAVMSAVPVLIAVPVVSRPVAGPHAVAPKVTSVALTAGLHAHGTVAADTGTRRTSPFGLVGATWAPGTYDGRSTDVEVRVHRAGGWSGWNRLEPTDAGADAGGRDARHARAVTGGRVVAEPVWVGDSDGVQARVVGRAGRVARVPGGLRVVLVDGGASAADAHPGVVRPFGADVASAAQARPTILTRADWGADESLRRSACSGGADYGSTILMGFVHHTDNANGYTQSQVPGIIRSIYAYHVRSNGWCDIGYNFLVDRFGRIWEGRYGGITKPVIGAHTGGFNTNTFGASLIGNFTSTSPSSAMLTAVEKLFAWRLGTYYRDPVGKAKTVAGSFSGSRYATGQTVTFNVVSGHRDADFTTCPGGAAYSTLPSIRTAVRKLMGTGFVAPAVSPSSVRMAGGAVSLKSNVVSAASWTLTVTDPDHQVVHTAKGSATRSTPVATSWNLTDDTTGLPVMPAVYTMRLTGSTSGGASAVPYTTSITVTPPVSLNVPSQVRLGASVGARGTGRPGSTVSVKVTSGGVLSDLGTRTVSSNGTWSATATPAVASHDLTWSVRDQKTGYVATRRTRVGPAVTVPSTSPSFVTAGSALTVKGTALPDNANTVAVVNQPTGASSPTTGTPVAVATSGSWSTSFVPTAPSTYWVKDGRGLASRKSFVYPVRPAMASAPSSGYAGRTVRVKGNAGKAPVAVTLSSRQGSASWTVVKQVTAGSTGGFSLVLPVPSSGSSVSWRVTTGYGPAVTGSVSILPTFPPTATGPHRSGWRVTHTVSGTAVPGDLVTVWTRPAGSTKAWVQAGSTKTYATKAWSFPLMFTADVDWKVTSPSGSSAVARTVIVPTIFAPHTSTAGAAIVVHGHGLPGAALTLFRQRSGETTWTAVRTLTVGTDGSWRVVRWPGVTTRFRATSHGQASRAVTVTVG